MKYNGFSEDLDINPGSRIFCVLGDVKRPIYIVGYTRVLIWGWVDKKISISSYWVSGIDFFRFDFRLYAIILKNISFDPIYPIYHEQIENLKNVLLLCVRSGII